MPPIVLDPPNNGATYGNSYYFVPTNAHANHPLTSVAQWKITVTTAQNNGGSLVTQTNWSNTPIGTCLLSNLPANNGFYYTQIVYQPPTGGTFVSNSNKFRSQP